MDELRPATRAYIATLLALAVAVTVVVASRGPVARSTEVIVAILATCCMAAAWLFPVPFCATSKLYVDTAVMIAAVLLLPPAYAALAVGAGTLLGHSIRRKSRGDWPQALFNSAQGMLATLAAASLLALAGWRPPDVSFENPRPLLILPVVAVVTYLLNVFLIAVVTSLEARVPVLYNFWSALREDFQVEALSHASLVTTGTLIALIAMTVPWGAVLLAVPIMAIHTTLSRQAHLRQEAERARLMSDAGMAEAQRLARLGSWEWYPTTNRWVWSDQVYRLFGLEPRSIIPTYSAVVSVIHPTDRERVEQVLQSAQRDWTPFEVEHMVRLHDGTEHYVHQRCEVRHTSGGPPALVGTIQDVTERVLAGQAMREATKAAQEADRAKSQLLTMASHDLRTPLTAIQGYIEMVTSGSAGKLTADQRELLHVAHRNTLTLAALVKDLLDLARIEAGRLTLRLRPTDINAAVEQALLTLAQPAAEKGISLRSAMGSTPCLAHADPDRLNQILLNLVDNAVKFTEQGGVTISASAEDGWVDVEVSDTGIGIPPDALRHIFEEFNQGGEEGRRKGGAGLGLAIVKQLVELHGGTISVLSVRGEGTTFVVRLPAAQPSADV